MKRFALSLIVGCCAWLMGGWLFPMPTERAMLALIIRTHGDLSSLYSVLASISTNAPASYAHLHILYSILWLSAPWALCYLIASQVHEEPAAECVKLLVEPPEKRQELYIILGGKVIERDGKFVDGGEPSVIPQNGLVAGLSLIGATRSGKTTAIENIVHQVLNWKRDKPASYASAMFLQVKGDFSEKMREIAVGAGRGGDFIEIGTEYSYNVMAADLSTQERSDVIAAVMRESFGTSHEAPFWAGAFSNLINIALSLIELCGEWPTVSAIYRLIPDEKLMQVKLREATNKIEGKLYWTFTKIIRRNRERKFTELGAFFDEILGLWMVPCSEDLDKYVHPRKYFSQAEGKHWGTGRDKDLNLDHGEYREGADGKSVLKRKLDKMDHELNMIWAKLPNDEWSRVVISCTHFLQRFLEPRVEDILCPPKDAVNMAPPMSEMIDGGKIVAVNFPLASERVTSRAAGMMLKLEFFRAIEQRLEGERAKEVHRPALLCIDEYPEFASKRDIDFCRRCGQANAMPIFSYQDCSSLQATMGMDWGAVFSSSRSRVFLGTNDWLTADSASKACGEKLKWRENASLSQQGRGPEMDVNSGMSASVSHHQVWESVHRPSDFMALNVGEAIASIFNGVETQSAERVKLRQWRAA